MVKIFLCYSSRNRSAARDLKQDLEGLNHRVWFDEELLGGHDWWDHIIENIIHADVFVPALSPDWLNSVPCRLEYEYAVALNKLILPILVMDVHIKLLPESIQRLQVSDYRLRTPENLNRLMQSLQSLPARNILPDPLPPPPAAPISPLTEVATQLKQQPLTLDMQAAILHKLKLLMSNSTEADDARLLMAQLRKHPYVYASIAEEISSIIGSPTGPLPPLPKTATLTQTAPLRPPARHENLTATPATTITGHQGQVYAVAFSPDGNLLATGSGDTGLKLWSVPDGKLLGNLTGHLHTVNAVAFSPDGALLASASADETIGLWDVATQRTVTVFTGHNYKINAVAFSADGAYLASSGDDYTVRLWDVTERKTITTIKGPGRASKTVAFSPDGKLLVFAFGEEIWLWDMNLRHEVAILSSTMGRIYSLAFAPDGVILATATAENVIQLWDVARRAALGSLKGHRDRVNSVTFSPDGTLLASASDDQTAKIWDVQARKELTSLTGHTSYLSGVAFSPDTQLLATSSYDETVRLWQLG